jgi:hypothetical protein
MLNVTLHITNNHSNLSAVVSYILISKTRCPVTYVQTHATLAAVSKFTVTTRCARRETDKIAVQHRCIAGVK